MNKLSIGQILFQGEKKVNQWKIAFEIFVGGDCDHPGRGGRRSPQEGGPRRGTTAITGKRGYVASLSLGAERSGKKAFIIGL